MAEPFYFKGCNALFRGDGDRVADLYAFANQHIIVSAWKLSAGELAAIRQTNIVMLGVWASRLPPVLVGSTESVRRHAADFGRIWPQIFTDRRYGRRSHP